MFVTKSQSVNASDLLQVAEICKKKGAPEVDVMPCDLSDMAAVDKFAEDVLKKYGSVDVIVNNAAILGPISYEGDATKNPNMGQGPIDGSQSLLPIWTLRSPRSFAFCLDFAMT